MDMNKRLTRADKTKIVSHALAHRFGPEITTLVARRANISLRAYVAAFTVAERDRLYDAPEGWFPETPNIEIQLVGGGKVALPFSGRLTREHSALYDWTIVSPEPAPVLRRVPFSHWHNDRIVKRIPDAVKIDAEGVSNDTTDLINNIKQTAQITMSAIGGFFTVKSLLSAFPNFGPFVAKVDLTATVGKLPAITPETLNKALGLPVED